MTGESKTKATLPVGSLWAFEGKTGDRHTVYTPSGDALTVVAYDGAVLVALTEAGEYVSGEYSVTAKA